MPDPINAPQLYDFNLYGVTQTIFGRGPEHQEPAGNCLQACLATVLCLPLESVPHFLEHGAVEGWFEAMNEWLDDHYRLNLFCFAMVGDSPWQVPPVIHLMVGRTERDSDHCVVGYAGQTIWDPHPENTGLIQIVNYDLFVAKLPHGFDVRMGPWVPNSRKFNEEWGRDARVRMDEQNAQRKAAWDGRAQSVGSAEG